MEELDRRGLAAGHVRRLVDLAHRAATQHASEAEATEHLVAPAAQSARLERLLEVLSCLAQERVALRERPHDAVVLFDGLERRLARLSLDDVRDEKDPLEDDHHHHLVEARERVGPDETRVGHDACHDEEGERHLDERTREVHGEDRARALADAEEREAERDDGRGRGEDAEVPDAGERAEDADVGDARRARDRVPLVAADLPAEPRARGDDGHAREPEDPLRDGVATEEGERQRHEGREDDGDDDEDARARDLLQVKRLARRDDRRGARPARPRADGDVDEPARARSRLRERRGVVLIRVRVGLSHPTRILPGAAGVRSRAPGLFERSASQLALENLARRVAGQ